MGIKNNFLEPIKYLFVKDKNLFMSTKINLPVKSIKLILVFEKNFQGLLIPFNFIEEKKFFEKKRNSIRSNTQSKVFEGYKIVSNYKRQIFF